jgi:hypothetical protein
MRNSVLELSIFDEKSFVISSRNSAMLTLLGFFLTRFCSTFARSIKSFIRVRRLKAFSLRVETYSAWEAVRLSSFKSEANPRMLFVGVLNSCAISVTT